MIDVIMPVYNEEKFTIKALESVLRQTLRPNKIIVVDDGSTDNSNAILNIYAKTTKIPIKIIKKENGGVSSARNEGIKNSTAEFIAFIDSDDTWKENKLEEQIRIFETSTYKNLGLVYTNYDHIDSDGIKIKDKVVKLDKKYKGQAFDVLLGANKILGSASGVLIRRKVFEDTGMFDENLKFAEDWDMWLRIAQKYEIDFIDEILVHIRKHSKNRTSHYKKNFEGELDFYNKWGKIISGNRTPTEWRDRVLGQLIRKLFNKDLLHILRKTLSPVVYKKMFPKDITATIVLIFLVKKTIQRLFEPFINFFIL